MYKFNSVLLLTKQYKEQINKQPNDLLDKIIS